MKRKKLLMETVSLAAGRVAIDLLDAVAAARRSLREDGEGDGEALHQFRVSIRRLRTSLRAYRRYLHPKAGGRLRKKLGRLTAATNAGRDDQVHIAYLKACLERKLPRQQRMGVRLMLDELEAQHAQVHAESIDAVAARFDRIEPKLRMRLERARVSLRESEAEPSFAEATGELISKQSAMLHEQLESVKTVSDQSPSHEARLTAKRLRYLLEPIRSCVTGGRSAIRRLKAIQDLLGEWHDLQTLELRVIDAIERAGADWAGQLAKVARRPGKWAGQSGDLPPRRAAHALAALLRRISADQNRLFARLQRRWQGEASQPFFALTDRIVGQLTGKVEHLPTDTSASNQTPSSSPISTNADAAPARRNFPQIPGPDRDEGAA